MLSPADKVILGLLCTLLTFSIATDIAAIPLDPSLFYSATCLVSLFAGVLVFGFAASYTTLLFTSNPVPLPLIGVLLLLLLLEIALGITCVVIQPQSPIALAVLVASIISDVLVFLLILVTAYQKHKRDQKDGPNN